MICRGDFGHECESRYLYVLLDPYAKEFYGKKGAGAEPHLYPTWMKDRL